VAAPAPVRAAAVHAQAHRRLRGDDARGDRPAPRRLANGRGRRPRRGDDGADAAGGRAHPLRGRHRPRPPGHPAGLPRRRRARAAAHHRVVGAARRLGHPAPAARGRRQAGHACRLPGAHRRAARRRPRRRRPARPAAGRTRRRRRRHHRRGDPRPGAHLPARRSRHHGHHPDDGAAPARRASGGAGARARGSRRRLRRRPVRAAVHRRGAEGGHAPLSTGVVDQPSGGTGRHARRLCDSGGLRARHRDVGHASPSRVLGGPRALRSRPLRHGRRAPPLRLVPVRRRAARLHRPALLDARGGARARHDRAPLRAHGGRPVADRDGPAHHAASRGAGAQPRRGGLAPTTASPASTPTST
jgi:hypothetical protein